MVHLPGVQCSLTVFSLGINLRMHIHCMYDQEFNLP